MTFVGIGYIEGKIVKGGISNRQVSKWKILFNVTFATDEDSFEFGDVIFRNV